MKKITAANLVQLIILSLLVGLVIYSSFRYGPLVTRLASQPEDLRTYVLTYGRESQLIFILIQALQVVIAIIPGELTQVAGGYIYGVWWGTLYSLGGIMLGTIIVFFTTRWLGYPLLKALIPRAQIERFDFFINSPRAEISAFLLFLTPGMPKDLLSYLAGLTPIRPLYFILLASLARLPGILVSSYIGAGLGQNQYWKAGLVSLLAAFLFLLGILYKDKIRARFSRINSP
jgi:uncharacterized membrane protein YdjX (TVP38/TMEM64 family)